MKRVCRGDAEMEGRESQSVLAKSRMKTVRVYRARLKEEE